MHEWFDRLPYNQQEKLMVESWQKIFVVQKERRFKTSLFLFYEKLHISNVNKNKKIGERKRGIKYGKV